MSEEIMYSDKDIEDLILKFTNVALYSNSHKLSREQLRDKLRLAKKEWFEHFKNKQNAG